MLLMALWLPATLHCRIESVSDLAFLQCADDHPINSDCEGDDACQSLESGAYKVEDNPVLITAWIVVPELVGLAQCDLCALVVPSGFTTAPPELPKTWQFTLRAADPPRPPSFAS